MTRERADALLYKEVWNWNGINKLTSQVKGFVFDHGIRTSPQNAIETTYDFNQSVVFAINYFV